MIDVPTNHVIVAVEYTAVVLGLIGNLLVAHKRRSGFALWVVSNILLVPLVLSKQMYGLAILYVTYCALAMYSFWRWHCDARSDGRRMASSAIDSPPEGVNHCHNRAS